MPTQKPSEFPDWATDPQTSPISGQPNFTTPPAEKQQFGWNYREIPPRQWFNWWMRMVGLWVRWLSVNVQETVEVDTNHTIERGKGKILANSSGGSFNLTLPASPEIGDEVKVVDVANTFSMTPVTLLRNGNVIESQSDDLLVDDGDCSLIFVGGAVGWRII